jgi:drug/metabolite transporter (DMT)-like permease
VVDVGERQAPVAASGDGPGKAAAATVMAGVVVIWGLGPPVTKLISAPPMVGASVRFWLAIPVLWGLAQLRGVAPDREVLRRCAVAGVLFGVNLAFVFAALQQTTVAVLSVIMALQPGVVLLVAGRWLGERPTRWHVAWTAVGIAAVAVVILGGGPEVRGDAAGIALGVGALLTFTGYYVLTRQIRSTTSIDAISWMAGVTLFAGVTVTPLALATSSWDDYGQLGGADWVYLGFVAIVVGIVGHTMMSWSHRFIAASRSSLYLLAMNVVAVAAAWPLHDEPVSALQALGGLVVLAAVAAVVSRPAAVPAAARTVAAPLRRE